MHKDGTHTDKCESLQVISKRGDCVSYGSEDSEL